MRDIICYRKGCRNKATWEIPGHPVLYICTACLKILYPRGVNPRHIEVGPTEFKEEKLDELANYPAL